MMSTETSIYEKVKNVEKPSGKVLSNCWTLISEAAIRGVLQKRCS